MHRSIWFSILALIASVVVLRADAPPIVVAADATRLITTLNGSTPVSVFRSDMGENGFANFTDDPAFVSTVLTPGEEIGLVALGPLRVWDVATHEWVYPLDTDEMIGIVQSDALLARITGVSGASDVGPVAIVDNAGGIDANLEFEISRPCGCLVSFGVFALRMQLTSSLRGDSQPFVVCFTYFLFDESEIAAALAAGPDLLANPPCGGDLTLDHQVGLSDLTILLANFGQTAAMPLLGDLDGDADVDLSDLTAFLGNFGSICTP